MGCGTASIAAWGISTRRPRESTRTRRPSCTTPTAPLDQNFVDDGPLGSTVDLAGTQVGLEIEGDPTTAFETAITVEAVIRADPAGPDAVGSDWHYLVGTFGPDRMARLYVAGLIDELRVSNVVRVSEAGDNRGEWKRVRSRSYGIMSSIRSPPVR